MKGICLGAVGLALVAVAGPSLAVDAAAADALVRKSKCLTCHAIEKKKDGPAYKEIAAKYKGKPEEIPKLIEHITVPNKVKVDGEEQDHELLRTKDPAEIRNVIDWILSL